MNVRLTCVATFGLFILGLRPALAQTPEQQADRLFNEAKALADAGKWSEACPKLEQSQKLDPGIGTEFNLADCYEHIGRVAGAYKLFREVANIARATGKAERETLARQRAQSLEGRVPRLTIAGANVAGTSGLVVRLDGDVLPADLLDKAQVLEAGQHTVEASAPGKQPWSSTVALTDRGASVEIPPLADAPQPGGARPLGTQRIVAIGVGAGAVVAVGVGAVFGALSLAAHNRAHEECSDTSNCQSAAGSSDWHTAVVDGNMSTVAFVGGGVLLATAAVLWFTAPSQSSVRVGVGPGSVGLTGKF